MVWAAAWRSITDCTATVNNSTFNKNVANGSQTISNSGQPIGGGGIENGGTLNLTSSVVQRKQGGLHRRQRYLRWWAAQQSGTATIQSSTFDGNEALGGGSYSAVGGSTGGGIANYDGPLSLANSAITNNQAISAATPAGSPPPISPWAAASQIMAMATPLWHDLDRHDHELQRRQQRSHWR